VRAGKENKSNNKGERAQGTSNTSAGVGHWVSTRHKEPPMNMMTKGGGKNEVLRGTTTIDR